VQQGSQPRGWTRIFYGWDVRPDRDEVWYEERRSEADDVARFEKEYPRDEDEALAPARTLVFFNPDTLMAMRQDLKAPIKTIPVGAGFYANIFQDFQVGKRYAAGTDTSHGVGQDFSVTGIIDAETGYTVADVMSPLMEPEQLSVASTPPILDSVQAPASSSGEISSLLAMPGQSLSQMRKGWHSSTL
jgi:hypothetical protein